jgi:hypothetical protein
MYWQAIGFSDRKTNGKIKTDIFICSVRALYAIG